MGWGWGSEGMLILLAQGAGLKGVQKCLLKIRMRPNSYIHKQAYDSIV